MKTLKYFITYDGEGYDDEFLERIQWARAQDIVHPTTEVVMERTFGALRACKLFNYEELVITGGEPATRRPLPFKRLCKLMFMWYNNNLTLETSATEMVNDKESMFPDLKLSKLVVRLADVFVDLPDVAHLPYDCYARVSFPNFYRRSSIIKALWNRGFKGIEIWEPKRKNNLSMLLIPSYVNFHVSYKTWEDQFKGYDIMTPRFKLLLEKEIL